MRGIQTHLLTVAELQREEEENYKLAFYAIRRIPKDLPSFLAYVEKVLEILHERIHKYDWVGFYRVEKGNLVLIASRGLKSDELRTVKVAQACIGCAVAAGKILMSRSHGLHKSELSAPMEKFGVVHGVLGVKSTKPDAFGSEDVKFLNDVASEMASRWHSGPID